MCIAARLVGGEAFSVDASLIKGGCGQEEASARRPADRLAERVTNDIGCENGDEAALDSFFRHGQALALW